MADEAVNNELEQLIHSYRIVVYLPTTTKGPAAFETEEKYKEWCTIADKEYSE